MELLLQKEFVEQYKNGKRLFENVLIQFWDIHDFELRDVTIKNSKILFCNFYDSRINNVKWKNCTVYYLSFYAGAANGMIFDCCDIEEMLFDNFEFEKTTFSKCNIRWSGILNSNFRNVDISTSSQYKFFTDITQITAQDIEEAIHLIMHDIERMDVTTRMKIQQMVRGDFEKYNLPVPEKEKKAYSVTNDNIERPLTYGEVRQLVQSTFGAYSEKKPYEMKKPYETQSKYE